MCCKINKSINISGRCPVVHFPWLQSYWQLSVCWQQLTIRSNWPTQHVLMLTISIWKIHKNFPGFGNAEKLTFSIALIYVKCCIMGAITMRSLPLNISKIISMSFINVTCSRQQTQCFNQRLSTLISIIDIPFQSIKSRIILFWLTVTFGWIGHHR